MTILGSVQDRSEAFLRGVATLFDLSGTGLLPEPRLGSLSTDLNELRRDFQFVGDDFRKMMRSEAERFKNEVDAGRR